MDKVEYNGELITLDEALEIVKEAQGEPHQFDYEFIKQVRRLTHKRLETELDQLKCILDQTNKVKTIKIDPFLRGC